MLIYKLIKEQLILMLSSRISRYDSEIKILEKKHGGTYEDLAHQTKTKEENFDLEDRSKLHVKEYRFRDQSRKYSYHWEDSDGNLIIRWDNAEHWKNLPTIPHHKHTSSLRNVSPSESSR